MFLNKTKLDGFPQNTQINLLREICFFGKIYVMEILYNSSVETFLKIGVADMSIILEDGQETVNTVHLCKKSLEMGMRRLLVLYLSVVFEISSYLHVLFIFFFLF